MRQSRDRRSIGGGELSPTQRQVLNYAKGVMLSRRVESRRPPVRATSLRDFLWAAAGLFVPLVLQYQLVRATPRSAPFAVYLALLATGLVLQASMLPRAWRTLRLSDSPQSKTWQSVFSVMVGVLLVCTVATLAWRSSGSWGRQMTRAEFEAAWSGMSEGERREVLREFISELSADYGLSAPDVQFGYTTDEKGKETSGNTTEAGQGLPVVVINDGLPLYGGFRQIDDPWECFDTAAHEFAHHGRNELGGTYEWGSGAHMNKEGWPSIEHFAWIQTQKVLDEIEAGQRFPYLKPGDTSGPYVHSTYWEDLITFTPLDPWGGALPVPFVSMSAKAAFQITSAASPAAIREAGSIRPRCRSSLGASTSVITQAIRRARTRRPEGPPWITCGKRRPGRCRTRPCKIFNHR